MTESGNKKVVVIGGGIIGVSAALWLKRYGHDVVLLDASETSQKASYGNAGFMAHSSGVPVTGPGLIGKAPAMLLDPNSALFMKWGYLPFMMPWLLSYLSHCNRKDTARIASGLFPLVSDGLSWHRALSEGTDAESYIQSSDYLFAYRSRKEFNDDSFTWELRYKNGCRWDELDRDELRDFEPSLSAEVGFGVLQHNHGFISNPGKYLECLINDFRSLGGNVVKSEARDIVVNDRQVAAVVTQNQTISCDCALIAAGAWSKKLCADLGVSIPLETERGYHVTFRGATIKPRTPVMVAAQKFIATPMEDGLRCAGIVEFGGLKAELTNRVPKLLTRQARAVFPGLKFAKAEEWLGHRPAPTDSLPIIGKMPDLNGVYCAFGHHHIGLTSGPKTGKIVADLISDIPVDFDLSPYRVERFSQQ